MTKAKIISSQELTFVKRFKGHNIFKSNKYYYVDNLVDKPLTSIRQCKMLIMGGIDMSKELESFYKIKDYGPVGHTTEEYDELVNTVLSGLKRLETIDNANADEALGDISILAAEMGTSKDIKFSEARFLKMLKEIRQVLLKYQEQKEDIIHYKGTVENLRRDNQLLKEELAKYKAIDDADPNEAMGWLDSEISTKKDLINDMKESKFFGVNSAMVQSFNEELKHQEVIKQYLLTAKEQKEMIVELCEYFGLDNLYPYDDLDDIEHALKNSRDMASHRQLQLLEKLNKQEKALNKYKQLEEQFEHPKETREE